MSSPLPNRSVSIRSRIRLSVSSLYTRPFLLSLNVVFRTWTPKMMEQPKKIPPPPRTKDTPIQTGCLLNIKCRKPVPSTANLGSMRRRLIDVIRWTGRANRKQAEKLAPEAQVNIFLYILEILMQMNKKQDRDRR